jgi:hypothetical protein
VWHGFIGNRRNVDNSGGGDKHYVINDINDINHNDDGAADPNFRCFYRCRRSRSAWPATREFRPRCSGSE